MKVQIYTCMACQYIGPETGPDYCQDCHAKFPPPKPDGSEACGECGSNAYDVSCPKCGAYEEFGAKETDPRYRAAPGKEGAA